MYEVIEHKTYRVVLKDTYEVLQEFEGYKKPEADALAAAANKVLFAANARNVKEQEKKEKERATAYTL